MHDHRLICGPLLLFCVLSGCQQSNWTQPTPNDDGGTMDAQDAAGPPVDVSVMALNLHCLKLDGTPFSSNTARMAAVADAVAAEGIAALALQEVCKNTREDGMALLVTELQRLVGRPS